MWPPYMLSNIPTNSAHQLTCAIQTFCTEILQPPLEEEMTSVSRLKESSRLVTTTVSVKTLRNSGMRSSIPPVNLSAGSYRFVPYTLDHATSTMLAAAV
ncbi:hypothetical protein JTB14_020746 [Gonioctena quinquepunctata]|nr:hypothetical protein JTB14_020746 [Gonioctena quinquepunctata]